MMAKNECVMRSTTMAAAIGAEARAADALAWLLRTLESTEGRADRATGAGAALAAAVRRFLDDPESVGRYFLAEAYTRYMGQHAGNFGPTTLDRSSDIGVDDA